jgi:poly(A) polymerase
MHPALLLQLRDRSTPTWILVAARVFAEAPDRWVALRATAGYKDLVEAACEQAAALGKLPLTPFREALEQVLLSSGAPAGLQWLQETQALKGILPELDATVLFSQEAGRRHKDVWEHTKQVVWQAEQRPLLRWSALLHDIGKVRTRTIASDGKVAFHHHSEVGARMFDDIARRLEFDTGARRAIRFLICHHLRPNSYLESWTDSAVRRFAKEMGPYLPDLLDLSRADITSRRPGRRQEGLENLELLSSRVDQIVAQDAVRPPLPSGVGNLIMSHFGLPPSRLIGELRRCLEEAIDAGDLEAWQAPAYYLTHVEKLLAERGEPALCCE